MNPPAAVQRPDAGPASPPRRASRAPIVLGVLAVVAVFAIAQLLATPHYVSRLTFQNPTQYELTIEVSNGHGDGWLPLGTVDRRSSTEFGEIYEAAVRAVLRALGDRPREVSLTFHLSPGTPAMAAVRARTSRT